MGIIWITKGSNLRPQRKQTSWFQALTTEPPARWLWLILLFDLLCSVVEMSCPSRQHLDEPDQMLESIRIHDNDIVQIQQSFVFLFVPFFVWFFFSFYFCFTCVFLLFFPPRLSLFFFHHILFCFFLFFGFYIFFIFFPRIMFFFILFCFCIFLNYLCWFF